MAAFDDNTTAFEIRARLDAVASRSAAQRIGARDLAELRRLVHEMDDAVLRVDVDRVVALDQQIHALVYQVGAPTALPPAVRSLDAEVRRGIATAMRNRVRTARVQREHHALLAAFECRDAEGAATVASDHMQNALTGAILRQSVVSDAP